MGNKQQTQPLKNIKSELEKFSLSFEYDKTYAEVRHDIRLRADKNLA